MIAEQQNFDVVCPTEGELLDYKTAVTTQCPVAECGRVIKNPSAMRMHLAQTHGIGAENVLQTFNKAFIVSSKPTKSAYACPVFTCSRTYGTGRYFKCFTTLREHYLSIHAEKTHVCQKCCAKFGNPKRLLLHSKTCKAIFYCTCGCPFKRKDALFEHTVRSQHELPEEIKAEMLRKNGLKASKGKNAKRTLKPTIMECESRQATIHNNPGSNFTQVLHAKPLVVVPQRLPTDNPAKPNAFLIISCQNGDNTDKNNLQQMSNQKAELPVQSLVQSKNLPMASETNYRTLPNGIQIFVKNAGNWKGGGDVNLLLNEAKGCDERNRAILPESAASPTRASDVIIDKNLTHVVPPKPEDRSAMRNLADMEKLKRVDEAMKQYIPIKKKSPLDPVIFDWHCSVPRRKYKKRKQKTEEKKPNSRNISGGSDEASVVSMQDCLQKASNFVKNMLPKMRSPRRGTSPVQRNSFNGTFWNSITDGTLSNRNKNSSQQVSQTTQCQTELFNISDSQMLVNGALQGSSFERSRLSLIISEDKNSVENPPSLMTYKDRMDQGSFTSLHEGGLSSSSQGNGRQEMLTSGSSTGQQTVPEEFSLDNLTPELLYDIETQTEDFSSLFSDAFTQTIQQSAKLIASSSQNLANQTDRGGFESNACWVNNNHTQTDNINQLIADAFTQTRIGLEENDSLPLRGGQNSMADNHTQTILSSDNFFKSFNFGSDDETLDSTLMPDLIDICTQTTPDPSFDELLALCSAGVQTSSSSKNM